MYAGRKRRRPVQRGVKPPPAEGAKSNPSKRHRDRLNSELERLAGLLPFPADITSSLDKLSILRLSVSVLRSSSFFSVALKNQPSNGVSASSGHHDNSKTVGLVDGSIPEGELLLQALSGFVLVVTAEGIVFFSSHTIQDYLGFHQTDVMQQSVFELIHTEDQQEFRRNLHWALNPPTAPPTDGEAGSLTSDPQQLPPENSSFLERSFVCRFRCLLDNSSGFLAMNLQGRLKFLHGQSRRQSDGEVSAAPPRLALFAIASPLQPPAILEIRTRNMIFRTKHKLDFTPMACDAKGKIVLGYTEAELRVRGTGYQFIHAADMLYCAENHVRMIKTGESGLTVFRLLTKDNRWKWVQANARLVYKNGKPDYIIATQRPLVEEEGGEHLRKRSMHLPFTFATGEALLYHTSYPLHGFPESFQGKTKGSKAKKGRLERGSADDLDPNSLLGALMSQDESVYVCQPAVEPKMSYHSSLFSEPQGEKDGFGGLLGGEGWNVVSNGLTARHDSEMSNYDPLLATLDSLSLDGDETCSNSELFSALENLGLNAEDLELLLLDERMIQVELDPNHIPTLSDLLTNNEILSYIHDSLESGIEGEEPGDGGGFGPPTHEPTPASAHSDAHQPQPCPPPAPHPALPQPLPNSRQSKQPPIVQLSQQMQQHMSSAQLVNAQQIPSLSQPGTTGTNNLTGIHNGHWVAAMENHCHPNNHTHPQTVLKVAQLNGEHKHLNQLRESNQPWQLHEGDGGHAKLLWPDYEDQLGLTTNGAYIPNGHTTLMQTAHVGRTDYNIADAPNAAGMVMNGTAVLDVCHYQGVVSATQPYQLPGHQKHQQQQQMLQQTQVPPSCLPQCQTQSPALELALSQPQHSLPSLEACGMFNTTVTQDATHSKLENDCILSTANAAYIRSCLMPNGNGVASGDTPASCPDGLAALQDSQKTGFFL
uniref:aryl hydrocarbon receptor-like n=1 Tax=Centroberyx gerrardi TaxID=166262 RepID=UPI003AAD6D07